MEASTIFGITIDIVALAAVFIYMPVANYIIKKQPAVWTDFKETINLILDK